MNTDSIENLPGEVWRDIEGYENLYCVSNKGRIKSLGNGGTCNSYEHLLKPINSRNYFYVNLQKNGIGKRFFVHRLVAEAFIPNPDNKPFINHRDETPCNNCVENLEWCTPKYNINYGTGNKRRSESQLNNPEHSTKVKYVDLKTNQEIIFPSINEAGRQLKIRVTTIWWSMYKYKKPYKNRYIFTEA